MYVHSIKSRKACAFILAGMMFFSGPGFAEFMRLGPFDFMAESFLQGVYTTNVEGQRPSEATDERTDYYLIWGLGLSSKAFMTPETTLTLDTGIQFEKHFVRTDLDNSEAPFGLVQLSFQTDFDPLRLSGGAYWERDNEALEDKYVPAGRRDGNRFGTTSGYDAAADWQGRYLTLGISYDMQMERFDSTRYAGEEKDTETFTYYAGVNLVKRIQLRLEVEHKREILINSPDKDEAWEKTERIDLVFSDIFRLLEHPSVAYSIGIERNYEDGETDGWELVHTLAITDDWDINSRMKLAYYADYTYQQNPDEDEITLQYGVVLDHQVSPTVSQSFSASQKPVDTLGSTDDTKETQFGWDFVAEDIFIYNTFLQLGTTYKISNPLDGETEKAWQYTVGLGHQVALSRALARSILYEYRRESSNLELEILDEHRVTLTYDYKF